MRSVRKESELVKPSPADTFVFIDEHPDSLNDGAFFPPSNPLTWSDLPASYHQRGAGVAMADGHVEMHSWTSRRTEYPVRFGPPFPSPVSSSDNADLVWLRSHTPQR
jgi:prepilin-type processing-associated H-X9-DG protein